jgi:hypothetical protein
MSESKIKMIQSVDCCDMPDEVEDYCIEMEYSTHYQNDIICVEDDGNVLSEWLKSIGFKFDEDKKWGTHVALFAT